MHAARHTHRNNKVGGREVLARANHAQQNVVKLDMIPATAAAQRLLRTREYIVSPYYRANGIC
jgi:hypothetical protein